MRLKRASSSDLPFILFVLSKGLWSHICGIVRALFFLEFVSCPVKEKEQ